METESFRGISRCIFQVLWLGVYWYYVEQMGSIEKGKGKRLLAFGVTAACLAGAIFCPLWLSWFLISAVILIYDLFFDGEPFQKQWWKILLPGICLMMAAVLEQVCKLLNAPLPGESMFLFHGIFLYVFLLLLSKKRESLHPGNGILTGAAFGLVTAFLWVVGSSGQVEMGEGFRQAFLWGGALLELILFLALEGTLYFYKKGFEHQAEQFRTELMEHNYGEIKEIYMDMRGWRHDYHNHMQVMKAQLAFGNLEGIEAYLDKLEKELDKVDTLVKSGNLMTDAILNSKLTLARRQEISVNCKAALPDRLPVEDVDLCVILGNLLDNAIEGCGRMAEGKRFLRVYMAVNKNQLYLSVQNSAREEPDFNERNYITKKRGNHGLGMKRVKAAVDKYQGFLNLANEPGIFAAEVTMPLC